MAITLRKGTEVAKAAPERDPFRLMKDMLSWEPFRDLMPAWRFEPPIFSPAFEVKETKGAFVFWADLPGVKEADLEIRLTGNRLSIVGKRESTVEEKDEAIFVYERCFGEFNRTFTLPEGIDVEHMRAELKEGVLRIVVPKLPEMQPKKIPIHGEVTKD